MDFFVVFFRKWRIPEEMRESIELGENQLTGSDIRCRTQVINSFDDTDAGPVMIPSIA